MNIDLQDFFKHSRMIVNPVNQGDIDIMRKRFLDSGLQVPTLTNGLFIERKKIHGRYPILDFSLPRSGIVGCTVSHLFQVQLAKELDWPFVVVFEQDAYPCKDIVSKLEHYLKDIPDDCGVLQIGYDIDLDRRDGQKYYNTPKTLWGGQAYIVFKQAYGDAIRAYERFFVSDGWWYELVKFSKFKHYVTHDCLFGQGAFKNSLNRTSVGLVCPPSQRSEFNW